MDAVSNIPEIDLVDVLIAGCAMFPGDAENDPPIIMRDLPVLVVTVPWDDVRDALSEWGLCDYSLAMTVSAVEAILTLTIYDPYTSFRVRVPLPDFEEAITHALACGWLGIQSDDGLESLLVRCK